MMNPTLLHFVCLSFLMFIIGAIGLFLNRRNLILMLMSLEIILLSVTLLFIAVARYTNSLAGEVFSLAILAVAAAETAIGLALLMLLYRKHKNISVEVLKEMKG